MIYVYAESTFTDSTYRPMDTRTYIGKIREVNEDADPDAVEEYLKDAPWCGTVGFTAER